MALADCPDMDERGSRELLDLAVAVEQQTAQEAGSLAYMARLFAQTSLPYRDPGDVIAWGRRNGGLSMTISPGIYMDEAGGIRSVGFPYGSLPRLILAWMSTEAVRTQSRTLYLGSLSGFMNELGLSSNGGPRGDTTRLRKQLERLLLARIVCRFEDSERGATGGATFGVADGYWLWWDPKEKNSQQEQLLPSTISLSEAFFEQVTTRPVPVDMRVLKGLKGSPLRLDIYTWLTHRLSYLRQPTHVSWAQLRAQFGANFKATKQGRYRFREDFEKQLGAVLAVYRDAKVQTSAEGLVLLPSRPHVSPKAASRQLKLPGSSVPLSRPEKGSESGPQVVEQYCVHSGEAGTLPDGAARCPSCRRRPGAAENSPNNHPSN